MEASIWTAQLAEFGTGITERLSPMDNAFQIWPNLGQIKWTGFVLGGCPADGVGEFEQLMGITSQYGDISLMSPFDDGAPALAGIFDLRDCFTEFVEVRFHPGWQMEGRDSRETSFVGLEFSAGRERCERG